MPFTRSEIEKLYGGRFIDGNDIELIRDPSSFKKIIDVLLDARHLICLEFYIYRNDETGHIIADVLKKKASEGVRVYVLYDHLGSFGTPLGFWRGLRSYGIHVRASHPFKWMSPWGYQHRDHRKLIIVDDEAAFTGGLNVANEYGGLLHRKKLPWRDTGIMLKGPVVFDLFTTFRKAWDTWEGPPIFHEFKSEKKGELPVMPIFAHSARGRRRLRRLLYYSINHASKDICLTTAYFTPSRRMMETLVAAVGRGVRVRLLVPGRSDVQAAYYAGRAFFGKLLKAGVEIHTYMGQVLHAKSYVFDRTWSIVGSANLDFQSLRWNDEGNVGILDEGFASELSGMFEKDISRSIKIDLEQWQERPLEEKIKERFYSLFRRRL